MSPERLREILDAARMILDAERKALNPVPGDVETDRDIALCAWTVIVTQLRLAAETSAYVPNSMRWSKMADEFNKWAAEEDRKEADEDD